MQAFKCDRCGIFYGKYKLTNEYSFRGAPIKVSSGDVGLDLCSDCRKKLIEFMESGKENDIPKTTCCDPGFYQEVPEKAEKPVNTTTILEGIANSLASGDKYPCVQCIHCKTADGHGCKLGVGVECLVNPEKYWEPKKDPNKYACCRCQHIGKDGKTCDIGVAFECSINPEKYWVEREDCKGKSCHSCRHEDGPFCKVNKEAKNWSDRCYDFAKWEPKEE